MEIREALRALQELPFASAIAESAWMFPSLESVHVMALALVVGTILFVDLRLLGVIWRRDDMRELTTQLLPWTWGAFVIAAATGLLMFSSNAVRYAGNPAFLAKIALLALAGLNMALLHAGTFRSVAQWRNASAAPPRARVAAALSIGLWAGIVATGRWIGFL